MLDHAGHAGYATRKPPLATPCLQVGPQLLRLHYEFHRTPDREWALIDKFLRGNSYEVPIVDSTTVELYERFINILF